MIHKSEVFNLSLFISAEEVQAEQVLQIAHHYLMVMSTFLIILYALHTYRSALQGMGDTVIPMVSGMVGGLCAAGNCVLQKDCIFKRA